jgi:hypothetical protein
MKTSGLQILILLVITALSGCGGDEVPPPDICGIYTGTRSYNTLSGETMIIDIQSIDNEGLSGVITFSNGTQEYSCSFTGQWQENDSDTDIYFDEVRIIERINYPGYASLYSYQAVVDSDEISGTMSLKGYYSGVPFRAKRSSPVPEIPAEDPDNPVTPDN